MINFELTQFDQTSLLFFVLSAVGLIRERRMLPFIIVVLGNLFHGALSATLLAALILWNRMDLSSKKWVQLKDAFGFLLILMAAITPEPVSQFSIFFGVIFMSFSFDEGGLGIIAPLLLLRQYFPQPAPIEPVLVGSALYWVAIEIIRWSKVVKKEIINAIVETICAILILFQMKDLALHWLDESALVFLGSGFLLIVLVLLSWMKWKKNGFFSFLHKGRNVLLNTFTSGTRFVSDQEPWSTPSKGAARQEISEAFNQLFWVIVVTLMIYIGFVFFSRGGLT